MKTKWTVGVIGALAVAAVIGAAVSADVLVEAVAGVTPPEGARLVKSGATDVIGGMATYYYVIPESLGPQTAGAVGSAPVISGVYVEAVAGVKLPEGALLVTSGATDVAGGMARLYFIMPESRATAPAGVTRPEGAIFVERGATDVAGGMARFYFDLPEPEFQQPAGATTTSAGAQADYPWLVEWEMERIEAAGW